SLGVMLYEMLAGCVPFPGKSGQVLALILTQQPDPPSRHRPDLDPALEAICLKAMAKKPADRYASMADFARALTQHLQAAQAAAPAAEPKAPPGARRWAWIAAVAAGVVLLLTVLVLVLSLLLRGGGGGFFSPP